MPITIVDQNWDGVTPPAKPGGWTYAADGSGAWATSASAPAGSLSGGNALGGSVDPFSAAYAFPNVTDPNHGDVQVRASFIWPSATVDSSGGTAWLLFARASESVGVVGATYYALFLDYFSGGYATGSSTQIYYNDGSSLFGLGTPLSFGGNVMLAPDIWYAARLRCEGTAISANIQRLSDGRWLQPDGSWGALFAACLSVTDSHVAGSGYAGLIDFSPNTVGYYTDDFLFESLAVLPPPPLFVYPNTPLEIYGQ